MEVNHKLIFWDVQAGTADVGAAARAQIAKATLALQEHPDVVFSSSAGGYDDSESPEIALLVPVDFSPLALQPAIERAVLAEGLTTKITLKSDVRFFSFEESEMTALADASVEDVARARESVDELVNLQRVEKDETAKPKELVDQLIEHFTALKTLSKEEVSAQSITDAKDFPSSVLLDQLSVSVDKYNRMKKARGSDIESEIKNLQDALSKLSTEKKTNAAVLVMVTSGLVTIGKAMWNAYSAVGKAGGVTPMISGLINSVGGVGVVSATASAIVAVISILWAILKK